MPELPELETTKRALLPHLLNQTINHIEIFQPKLRYLIDETALRTCINKPVLALKRRAKYLLIAFSHGSLMVHLGMSGRLSIQPIKAPRLKHDHVVFTFNNKESLRYNDARRFGFILFDEQHFNNHSLISRLGPEPLSDDFHPLYLAQKAINKRVGIKRFIMDNAIVVGVGNIYATESLFLAKLHPETPVDKITSSQWALLCDTIKAVLEKAIALGGTTLKDFYHVDGKPGYFAQTLNVYGRGGQACFQCQTPIASIKIDNRSSAFCPVCQLLFDA